MCLAQGPQRSDEINIFISSMLQYALVICNHRGPPALVNSKDFLSAVRCYICITPTLQEQPAGKTIAVLPCSLSCFTLHCHVCQLGKVYQTPDISLKHGTFAYPRPAWEGGGGGGVVVTINWCIKKSTLIM